MLQFGGGKKPMDILKSLLGEEPNHKYLLRELEIVDETVD